MIVQLDRPPLTVFATAYDKYAVNAFETNAIDYLLKPIEGPRLEKAVHKIRAAIDRPRQDYQSALRQGIAAFRAGSAPAKLDVRRGKRIVPAFTQINVVLNWFTELQRRVPVK